ANLHRLCHFEEAGRGADRALIADLAALLPVKRSAFGNQADLRFGEAAGRMKGVIRDPAQHYALDGWAGPFGPVLGRRQTAAKVYPNLDGGFHGVLRCEFLPQAVVFILIDGELLFRRHLSSEVRRKAMRCIKVEDRFTADDSTVSLRLF